MCPFHAVCDIPVPRPDPPVAVFTEHSAFFFDYLHSYTFPNIRSIFVSILSHFRFIINKKLQLSDKRVYDILRTEKGGKHE